jgi:hypothetical protein
MAVKLSPIGNSQVIDANGNPAVGWTITTYAAGSSTPLATYTDATGSTPQPASITLNALGLPEVGQIWLTVGLAYKFIVKNAGGVSQFTIDNISGVNDASISTSQWTASGVTPTYISASSFTLVGDQTSEFHVGRRLQFTIAAGTVYGTISVSAYTTLTTVTMIMDSGQALDSGLSVVNVSILRADRAALPNSAAARASIGVGPTTRTKGLIGNVNATTPLTKFDLSADEVVLVDVNGGTVRRTVTGTLTCDLGLAGSAANGRDQAAAFTANSHIRLFFIWNGTTLATIASTASHTTGPTLPTGYTHWTYAGSLRWNASGNIIPIRFNGSKAWLELDDAGVAQVVSGGASTTFATVALSGLVPTEALSVSLQCYMDVTHNAVGAGFAVYLRPTGSARTIGTMVALLYTLVAAARQSSDSKHIVLPLGTSQQIDYRMNGAPSTSGGAYIAVYGFTMPNGDA